MKHTTTPMFTLVCLSTAYFSFSQLPSANLVWQRAASVRAIEFSDDATRLVTGGGKNGCYPYACGQIQVWNTSNGNLLNTIAPYNMGLTNDVDINSTGQTILSGNGTAYCYPDGGCAPDKPGQFKFSVDGTLLNTVNNSGGNVYTIKYSPDESAVTAGTGYNNSGDIRIYDNDFNLVRILEGHQYETDGLVFTPDGKYLISGGDDGLVKIWNYKTGMLVRTLTHGDYFNGGTYIDVDISPNGQYLSSTGSGYNMTTKIWRTSDGLLQQTLNIGNGDGYSTARFTPDGKYIVAATTQYGAGGLGWHGRILIWNVSDGRLIKEIINKEGSPLSGGISAIAFSPVVNNGYYFAYTAAGNLKVYRINLSATIAGASKQIVANGKINATVFPNPFQTTTAIYYTLPAKQFVTITISDINGKQVVMPVNAIQETGKHQTVFDGTKLAVGVYICKIITKNSIEIKKLVLTR